MQESFTSGHTVNNFHAGLYFRFLNWRYRYKSLEDHNKLMIHLLIFNQATFFLNIFGRLVSQIIFIPLVKRNSNAEINHFRINASHLAKISTVNGVL